MQSSPQGQHFPFFLNWKKIQRRENLYQSIKNQTLRMQGPLISFSFFSFQPLTFFSSPLHFPNIKSLASFKINVLKLLTQNFNLVICNHEKGYNHHKQMKHYMISYNHILNIHQINFIQNPTEWSSTVGHCGAQFAFDPDYDLTQNNVVRDHKASSMRKGCSQKRDSGARKGTSLFG